MFIYTLSGAKEGHHVHMSSALFVDAPGIGIVMEICILYGIFCISQEMPLPDLAKG